MKRWAIIFRARGAEVVPVASRAPSRAFVERWVGIQNPSPLGMAEKQVPPLRFAPVGMTILRLNADGRVLNRRSLRSD